MEDRRRSGLPVEDEGIIALFFARSEEAIAALDRKYGGRCRTLSYHILGSREDAEECVNDAYLGVWNTVPPARPDPLLTYLLKIVRNLSLKACCRRGAARRDGGCALVLEELEWCLPGGGSAEEAVEARELARHIERFLDTLTWRERVIFMRRYAYMDPYRDIARRMGISEKNVSARISGIRRKLRAYLEERGML